HIGVFALASTPVPLHIIVLCICAILAWGGLSAHLQVRAALRGSDVRYRLFFLARITQACIAFLLGLVLWGPFNQFFPAAVQSFADVHETPLLLTINSLWPVTFSEAQMIATITILLVLQLAAGRIRNRYL